METSPQERTSAIATALIIGGLFIALVLGKFVGAETGDMTQIDTNVGATDFNWLLAVIAFGPFLIGGCVMAAAHHIIRALGVRQDVTRRISDVAWQQPAKETISR